MEHASKQPLPSASRASSQAETPERYRQQAEELRKMAAAEKDPTAQGALLSLALQYEALAKMLERRI